MFLDLTVTPSCVSFNRGTDDQRHFLISVVSDLFSLVYDHYHKIKYYYYYCYVVICSYNCVSKEPNATSEQNLFLYTTTATASASLGTDAHTLIVT